jgi:TRAP-type C4-dicarboxylate transport system permease small subunit
MISTPNHRGRRRLVTSEQQPQRTGILRRIARYITGIELVIGGVSVLMILVLVFYQALQRYLPFESLAWTGELARFALLWATFAAMGVLVTTHGHIALELVDSLRSPIAVRVIQVISLVILVQSQGIVKSPVLRVPMSWVYIPVLIGVVSTTIRALIAAADIAIHGPIVAEIDEDQPEVAGL